jgi:hypothetical protein
MSQLPLFPAPAAPRTSQPLVVSYGAGVDSTAMLIGLHARGMHPDAILFADTGGEKPGTYGYLWHHITPWLEARRLPAVTVVRYEPRRFKRAPYSTLEENCLANQTLPSLAFGRKACSQKWKVAPMDRWVERHPRFRPYLRAGGKVTRAIGYDAGPKDSKRGWNLIGEVRYDYWYPLRDWGWDRARCAAEILAAGLPVPPKSACFFCPATSPAELAQLRREHPDLAARIERMEEAALPTLTQQVKGLWGAPRKKPGPKQTGRMTDYLRELAACAGCGGAA